MTRVERYKAVHMRWRRAFRKLRDENERFSRLVAAEVKAAERNDRLFEQMKQSEREECRKWLARVNKGFYK